MLCRCLCRGALHSVQGLLPPSTAVVGFHGGIRTMPRTTLLIVLTVVFVASMEFVVGTPPAVARAQLAQFFAVQPVFPCWVCCSGLAPIQGTKHVSGGVHRCVWCCYGLIACGLVPTHFHKAGPRAGSCINLACARGDVLGGCAMALLSMLMQLDWM